MARTIDEGRSGGYVDESVIGLRAGAASVEVSTSLAMDAGVLPGVRRPSLRATRGGAPQTAASTQDDRALFPRNWARGYTDFEVARLPPTNPTWDAAYQSTGQFGGAAARCAGFARYMLSGYFELHPIGRTPLRRVFLFASPRLSLGDNVPQVSYTAALTRSPWKA